MYKLVVFIPDASKELVKNALLLQVQVHLEPTDSALGNA